MDAERMIDEYLAEANTISKYGNIQIIDYLRYDGHKCDSCDEESAYALTVGNQEIHLCYECLCNVGHCVIDGLC